MVPPRKIGRRGWSCRDVSPLCVTNIRRLRSLPAKRRVSAAGARFLNERPVWGAASGNRNSEDGRKADLIVAWVRLPFLTDAVEKLRPWRGLIGLAKSAEPRATAAIRRGLIRRLLGTAPRCSCKPHV